jgi:hypothetical protein
MCSAGRLGFAEPKRAAGPDGIYLPFRKSVKTCLGVGRTRGLRTRMPSQEETLFDPWVAVCLLSWALAMLIWVTIE